MSKFPCEILDHIVDLLHDSETPLRNCCLVSKSWIPRARTHLFAEVHFQTAKSLESWKKTFPNPSTSPARYAKTLIIRRPQVIAAADAEAGCWVGSFPHVARLVMVGRGRQRFVRGWGDTFALFRGISPVIKSFRVDFVLFPSSQLFDLILSFPLLEDLSVTGCCHSPVEVGGGFDRPSTPAQPSNLLMFTGSLELDMRGGMEPVAHRLLSLAGGIHFRKLTLKLPCQEDIPLAMTLVEKCSHVLESLDITYDNSCADSRSASFDLSKATKLRDVVFRLESLRVEWITLALQVVASENCDLSRISVDVPHYLTYMSVHGELRYALGEGVLEEWLDLDRILVHLWESLSIRTNVIWTRGRWEGMLGDYVGCLLPGAMKRGMVTVDLVG